MSFLRRQHKRRHPSMVIESMYREADELARQIVSKREDVATTIRRMRSAESTYWGIYNFWAGDGYAPEEIGNLGEIKSAAARIEMLQKIEKRLNGEIVDLTRQVTELERNIAAEEQSYDQDMQVVAQHEARFGVPGM